MLPATPPNLSTVQAANRLLDALSATKAQNYIGEDISQLEHALQAAHGARRSGARDELVVAALFHDIGHEIGKEGASMGDLGAADHEQLGAEYLASFGLPASVTEPVREHVNAKRYLAAVNPGYARKLSAASLGTLEWQGGAMSDTEVSVYEKRADLRDILRLRAWDERAKEPDARVPPCHAYFDTLVTVLEKASA